MATRQVTTCDRCGTKRLDEAIWFTVGQSSFRFSINPPPVTPEVRDICGAACLHVELSEWLTKFNKGEDKD